MSSSQLVEQGSESPSVETTEVAVRVTDLHKEFLLPHEKRRSVKSAFTGLLRKRERSVEHQHVLKGISFEIKKGEFFGIVGRNGSGKSTLLKMLAKIYRPTSGTIEMNGSIASLIELGVGFNEELTGRENVYLNGAMLGFSTAEVDAMYDDVVEFAGLENFMDQKLKNYSSGMHVRLAFSVATRAKADILIVDEVLAVGDADFQRKCFGYFSELKGSDTTVILVTHDMSAVQEYCDQAVMIEQGEIISSGHTDEVADTYRKLFLRKNHEGSRNSRNASENQERWGEGGVTFAEATLVTDELLADDSLVIRVTLEATESVSQPVVGFLIKGADGSRVYGMNSRLTTTKVRPLASGESASYEWQVPNVFADGIFSIDLAVESFAGVRYDYWERALDFRVTRTQHVPFHVFVPVDLRHIDA